MTYKTSRKQLTLLCYLDRNVSAQNKSQDIKWDVHIITTKADLIKTIACYWQEGKHMQDRVLNSILKHDFTNYPVMRVSCKQFHVVFEYVNTWTPSGLELLESEYEQTEDRNST